MKFITSQVDLWEATAEAHRDAMRAKLSTNDGTIDEQLFRAAGAADAVAAALKKYAVAFPANGELPPAAPSPAKVFAATFSSKHGENTRVFATREAAEGWRVEIANRDWSHIMDINKPSNKIEMSDAYFNRQNEAGEEFFSINETDVEGQTTQSVPVAPVASDRRIVVTMEGGLIQAVSSADPALIGMTYTVIDYDTEGSDAIGSVEQSDGTETEAHIGGGEVDQLTVGKITNSDAYEKAARAAGWNHGGDFDGFWYDANRFESWKAAASSDDGATYSTAKEVCESEDIEVTPAAV